MIGADSLGYMQKEYLRVWQAGCLSARLALTDAIPWKFQRNRISRALHLKTIFIYLQIEKNRL